MIYIFNNFIVSIVARTSITTYFKGVNRNTCLLTWVQEPVQGKHIDVVHVSTDDVFLVS